MKNKIQKVLLELEITPNLKGFNYICRMVEIVKADELNEKSVFGIYEEIAEEYKTKSICVERAIRHAISKADKESDAWKKYVGLKDIKKLKGCVHISYKYHGGINK